MFPSILTLQSLNFCSWKKVSCISWSMFRSSRPEVFCKKGVLRNFAKFTGKHLCQSLFLIKLQASVLNFVKKETLSQVFSCKFYEISKNINFIEHLWWLLLYVHRFLYKNLDQSSNLNNLFWACIVTFDWFIFLLPVCFNADFNRSSSVVLSSGYKFTTKI